jgi:hypothetical protein
VIPTVLKSDRHSAPGVRFQRVVEYVGRDDEEARAKGQEPLSAESCGVFNIEADCGTPQDRQQIWQIMSDDAMSARNYKGNPVYHFDVSWMEGEHPTRDQLESAARHFIDGLGFGKCQTFWAVHRDTDNDHLHIVVNKVVVDPENGRVAIAEKPRFDYRILACLAREMEIGQGWERAPGHYVAVEPHPGDKKIMTMKEAATRGLWNEDWEKQKKLSRNAVRAEHNLGGGESFQSWVSEEPARALYETIHRPGATWAKVHETLAQFGVGIEPKGSGMVVTAMLNDGRVLAAKASQLGKWASKSALEKYLGTYEVPEKNLETLKKSAQKNYESAVRDQRISGNETRNSDTPAEKSRESQREIRAAERAAARKALVERFERERGESEKALRQQQRAALRERHQDERKALKATLAEQRRQLFRAAKSAHRRVTPIELALHARERAMRLEVLQKTQREERRALSKSFPTRPATWRAWLEIQAERSDADAQAALRGIRYQEQRRKKQQANAIAGAVEEEEQQRVEVLTVANLKAEIDRRLQWVVYKSLDGDTRMIDQGHRIVVKDSHDDTLEAALRVASAKYRNQITITGTAEFRERAARMAVQLGINVKDADLQGTARDEHDKREASRRRLDRRGKER